MANNRKAVRKNIDLGVQDGTIEDRIEAVSSPNAQSATLCEPGSQAAAAVNSVYKLLMRNTEVSNIDKAVIELQLISGARIGSVLQITPNDISQIGQIRIPPEKGGQSVIVTPQLFREVWLNIKKTGTHIAQFRDRFYYYRLYRKYGIYIVVEGNSNASVTHALRHAVIANTEAFNINERERANYAGQKSTKSQESYLPSKRKGSKVNKRGSL